MGETVVVFIRLVMKKKYIPAATLGALLQDIQKSHPMVELCPFPPSDLPTITHPLEILSNGGFDKYFNETNNSQRLRFTEPTKSLTLSGTITLRTTVPLKILIPKTTFGRKNTIRLSDIQSVL